MISALDISTNTRLAQRIRLNVAANNLANMSTPSNEDDELDPWQPRYVALQTDEVGEVAHGVVGFKVRGDHTPAVAPFYKYHSNHPWVIDDRPRAGYVAYPRMNRIEEFVNAVEATRAYQANMNVIEITKDLGEQTLRILA